MIPQFSVLMSVYHKENAEFLELSLKSILNQTIMPEQIILVKDGELTNELDEVIDSFKKVYYDLFTIVYLVENRGLAIALNEGLKVSRNSIIARMDTDDICYIDRFEKQIKFLKENPEISVLGGIVQEFNNVPGDLKQFRNLPFKNDQLLKFAKYRNPLSHPSVMFKKEAVINVGSYQDMPLFEDYYLWVRLLKNNYKIANLDVPILHFRIGNDMIGRRSGLAYAKKELHFLKKINELKFISKIDFFKSVIMKIPLRLLPKSILTFLYKKLLR